MLPLESLRRKSRENLIELVQNLELKLLNQGKAAGDICSKLQEKEEQIDLLKEQVSWR
jgi:hypothetical protein